MTKRYTTCRFCHESTLRPPSEGGSDTCKKCDKPFSDVAYPSHGVAIHVFRSGYYEHIDLNPIYIRNKAELKAQTEDRGLTSHYIH